MNISTIKDCYGCGVCAISCGKNIIELPLNEDGFYQPRITDVSACTDCGLCTSVCAFLENKSAEYTQPLTAYAAWSKHPEVRRTSTSGGVCYEIGHAFIDRGYKVCGTRYDVDKNRVEHYVASTAEELEESKGSKYLQSYTLTGFGKINKREKNVVIGTPCQIASFRNYIKKFRCEDNFLLIDFFCHGVPSKLMWDKYLAEHQPKVGKLNRVSWRNKLRGWHNGYCITLEGEKETVNSYYSNGDDFFLMFIGDACLNKPCYDSCKFKYNSSSADIRLGDFWGTGYKDENNGVNSVVIFTKKGHDALLASDVEVTKHTFGQAGNGQMKKNPERPWYWKRSTKLLKEPHSKLSSVTKYIKINRLKRKIINRMKRLL